MLPPVSPSVLSSNPKFAHLYRHLTAILLDPDASTRSTNLQQSATRESLEKFHLEFAKQQILKRVLRNLAGDESLSDELRELVYVVSRYVSEADAGWSRGDLDLLRPELQQFTTLLPEIGNAVSQQITEERNVLIQIAQAGAPPSCLPLARGSASLVELLPSPARHTYAIAKAQQTLTETTIQLLSLQMQQLTSHISDLELRKYGLEARHVSSRAQHLSTVAEEMALKTRVVVLEDVRNTYDARTQEALRRYARHLSEYKSRVEEREAEAMREVKAYERCDGEEERVMHELGRKYGDVLKEIEDVKRDIEQLRGGQSLQVR